MNPPEPDLPDAAPPAHERAAWWPKGAAMDTVTECALRFDGARREEELAGEAPATTYGHLAALWDTHYGQSDELHPEPLHNFAIFFYLQRRLKWLCELTEREARIFVRLFLALHDAPVPRGYEREDFLRRYAARRGEIPRLVARLSRAIARKRKE